jgi:hypothetical protein
LNEEELNLLINAGNKTTRTIKNQLARMDEKTSPITINPITAATTRYNEIQEKLKMSSKHNTSENLLFRTVSVENRSEQNNRGSIASYFNQHGLMINTLNNIDSVLSGGNVDIPLLDYSRIDDNFSFSQSNRKKKNPFLPVDHTAGIGNNSNMTTITLNKDLEEEQILHEKIKEAKVAKKNKIKGLTSIHHNREYGRILVNSMSHSQFIYDSVFYDKYQPLELKSHTSTFYVKSVLSPNCDYVLSGSNDAIMYIWKAERMNVSPIYSNVVTDSLKFSGFHKSEVSGIIILRLIVLLGVGIMRIL